MDLRILLQVVKLHYASLVEMQDALSRFTAEVMTRCSCRYHLRNLANDRELTRIVPEGVMCL